MNFDLATEMFFGGNINFQNNSSKFLTRDIPTTSTSHAVNIGTWSILNGVSFFEILIQVNNTGFTISKYYKFSIINNSTSGSWNKVTPEVDSGSSNSNNFELEINSDNSTFSLRIHRTGGSTQGEAKVYIKKYGSNDDVFVPSSTSSNVGVISSTIYPRSFGSNYILLSESNTFTSHQTINSRLTVSGDGVNFPAIRFGGGVSNLSANKSSDGSFILQGTTLKGEASQFEIIAPNNSNRLILEASNQNGVSISPLSGYLKCNTNSGSLFLGGTSSINGLLFGSSVTGSINADVGITRSSSGNLRITNGSSALGNLSLGKIRVNSSDLNSEFCFISGDRSVIENIGTASFIASSKNSFANSFSVNSTGSFISYDQAGSFSLISQSNSLVRNSPGTGSLNTVIFVNTNRDIAIGHTNPVAKLDVNGSIKGTSFAGNGASITNLNSTNLVGTLPASLLPNPGISSLGGIKRNIGATGSFVTGVSSDGSLLFSPTVSTPSKKIASFKPFNFEFSGSSAPPTGTVNNRPVLKFESVNAKSAMWTDTMPDGIILTSGIDVYAWWSSDVTVGTIGWKVAFEKIADNSIISGDNFSSEFTIPAVTVPSAGAIKKTSVNLPLSSLSGVSGGDMYRIKISRDVALDTANGSGELHMLELKQAY